jgi:hypothetical protein
MRILCWSHTTTSWDRWYVIRSVFHYMLRLLYFCLHVLISYWVRFRHVMIQMLDFAQLSHRIARFGLCVIQKYQLY